MEGRVAWCSADGAAPQQVFTQGSQRCLSLCGHVLQQSQPGEKSELDLRRERGQGWSREERSLPPSLALLSEILMIRSGGPINSSAQVA